MNAAPARRSAKLAVRAARRDINRQHLLEAAERVFADSGYEGTRMQDVAEQSGLALATVYGIFGGKEDLYAEIHRARGRALLERALGATVGAESSFSAILAGVRAYAEYLLAHPHYLRLHLQESQPWALAPRFHSVEQGRLWREGLELSIEMFRAAIAEGSVIDESPGTLARLMIAAHQVFLGEWVAEGMKEPAHVMVARMQLHLQRSFAARKPTRRKRT